MMTNILSNYLRWSIKLTAGPLAMMALVACNGSSGSILQHKLVATSGEHSIPMYPDEQTFMEVARRTEQGGVTGAVGDVQKTFSAKEIDDQTAVTIISSDSHGDQVQIVDGPMKSQVGFVAPQNVD